MALDGDMANLRCGTAKCFARGFVITLVVILVLLTACVLVAHVCESSKKPESIFEEMYYSGIDCTSLSALLCEGGGGIWPPRDYTLPALDPDKDYSLENMGAKWTPLYTTLNVYRFNEFGNSEGVTYPIRHFNRYYGRFIYEVAKEYTFESGRHARLSSIEITREDTGDDVRKLIIDYTFLNASNLIELMYSSGGDSTTPRDRNSVKSVPPIQVRAQFDLESNELSLWGLHCNHVTDAEALSLAKEVVFDILVADYLSASDKTKYSQDDLGDWHWGSVSVANGRLASSLTEYGYVSGTWENYDAELDHG